MVTRLRNDCRYCTLPNPREGHKHGAPLSSTTVRHIYSFLDGCFRWADGKGFVHRNPCKGVDRAHRARPKTDAYTDAEVAALLDSAKGTRWEAPLKLALATGARRGELAALRWSDVYFETDAAGKERGSVTIARSIAQVGRILTIKTTKTDRIRTVPLSALGLESLRIARFQQQQDAFAAEGGYFESGFVFSAPLGEGLAPRDLTLVFEMIREKAGVKEAPARRAPHGRLTVARRRGRCGDDRQAAGSQQFEHDLERLRSCDPGPVPRSRRSSRRAPAVGCRARAQGPGLGARSLAATNAGARSPTLPFSARSSRAAAEQERPGERSTSLRTATTADTAGFQAAPMWAMHLSHASDPSMWFGAVGGGNPNDLKTALFQAGFLNSRVPVWVPVRSYRLRIAREKACQIKVFR